MVGKQAVGNGIDLDGYDIAILRILQKDNTTPQREISDQIFLSPAAVQRRIKRMQSSGVIESNIAVLNPAKVGKPITLVVEVEIENEHIDLMDAARESFSKAEEVQQCYYVTGEADFVIIVSVRDMSHYEEFTRRVFFQNHNVKHFKTMVVMDRVKTTLSAVLPA